MREDTQNKREQQWRQEGVVSCEVHEGGKKWKYNKEMAQHLRLEAILTIPPSLLLTLIITVF